MITVEISTLCCKERRLLKLKSEDKALLLFGGYEERNFPQIENALRKRMTTYKLGNKPISREKAIAFLGMRDFLSGVARSAFHWLAARVIADGKVVHFDSHKLFI